MKKIGITSTGMVIVEMTAAQFDSLEKAAQSKTKPQEKQPFTPAYVLPRLLKSKPGTKEAVARFIAAMFQFQDDVVESDVGRMISRLEKAKALRIDDAGKVTYREE